MNIAHWGSSGRMAWLPILSGKSPAQYLSLSCFMRPLPSGYSWIPRVKNDCRRPSTNYNGLSSCPGAFQHLVSWVSSANWKIRPCLKLSSTMKNMFCTISSPVINSIYNPDLDRTTKPYHLPTPSSADILSLVCSTIIFVSLHRACNFFYFHYFSVILLTFSYLYFNFILSSPNSMLANACVIYVH